MLLADMHMSVLEICWQHLLSDALDELLQKIDSGIGSCL